jgi:hypothetical protein
MRDLGVLFGLALYVGGIKAAIKHQVDHMLFKRRIRKSVKEWYSHAGD